MTEERQRENNLVYYREIGDGRYIGVQPRPFNSIIQIGRIDDEYGYDTHWCYTSPVEAIYFAEQWNPLEQKDPDGWFRHAASGRRRPDGDPEKEYINP